MSVKISELPILDSLADNDVIAGVDTSANVTSKIEMATLKNYIDTNTQYTAGTNINITDNVISAPFVYDKTQTNALLDDFKDETNALIEDLETSVNEQLEEKDEQIEELQSEVDSLSTIFNAFPTESGEGESLTLDDTAEVKFKKFDLKGNTSQTTYSGKNLLNNTLLTTTVTKNGITATPHSDGSITFNGTATTLSFFNLSQQDFGENGFNSETGGAGLYVATDGGTLRMAYDPSNHYTYIQVNNGLSLNNVIIYPMIRLKTITDDTYEPYVGGTASPNPSYPQPVNVVSGDNEIQVCRKNLHDFSYWIQNINRGTNITYSNRTDSSVDITASARGFTAFGYNQSGGSSLYRAKVEPNTEYTFSYNGEFISGTQGIGTFVFMADNINGDYTTLKAKDFSTNVTFTTTSTTNYIWFRIDLYNVCTYRISNIQLEKGSGATDFEPYQGNTYNIDLPVENLFDKNSNLTLDYRLSNIGENYSETGYYISEYIPIKSNTTYTKNSPTADAFHRVCFYSNNDTTSFISKSEDNTFTTPSNAKYLRFCGLQSELDITQLEVGSKQNNFTPYGTTPIELCKIENYQDYFYKDSDKWYLHKEIGKVVLNGSENWTKSSTYQGNYYCQSTVQYAIAFNVNCFSNLTNIFWNSYTQLSNGDNGIMLEGGGTYKTIDFKISSISTLDDFKSFLGNTNLILYYVLATSTNTEITYQPLIDQLNLLEQAMSKDGQTNISQVNNDKPFILDVTAIKSLQNILDRIELLES